MNDSQITFFAETNFRNERRRFGIKTDDRRRHMYVIGQTGTGKTTMMENMVISDILAGNGVGVVDPHGEFAEKILDFIPKERVKDVIYFNPADLDFPIAFNAIEKVDSSMRHLVASGLMGVFKKIWPDVWSARMEYILNNTILALLEYPGSTLLGVNRMFSDKEYRKTVVDQVKDPVVKAFWTQEYARYQQRYEQEATAAIQNKVGQFISAAIIRNIIGQETSSFDIRKAMDERKILIINLSKGRIGEDNSKLLGGMLITKLQLAAMSRVDIPEEKRKDFYLYVDEFQNFVTDSFATILSEARKYRLNLILANQYLGQLIHDQNVKVRDAVFGNVGTFISFRTGGEDVEFLEEKQFGLNFTAADLLNLPNYNVYLRLMIDGVPSAPFSAMTLPPSVKPPVSYRDEIIGHSRENYGTSRTLVEENISRATSMVFETETQPKEVQPKAEGKMFETRCASCGKITSVPFEPDGKRPVYCKECFEKSRPRADQPRAPKQQPEIRRPEAPQIRSFIKGSAPREFVSGLMKQISLSKLSAPKGIEKKPKKAVDIGGLRKILKETISEKEENSQEKLRPGERIKF